MILITSSVFSPAYGELLQTFDDPTVTMSDFFGTSVSIDGNYVLVGALGDDTKDSNVGQAYLFSATSGALLLTFDDPTITTFDSFGAAVAIDGNYVLVGAPGDDTKGSDVGQAYLYDKTTCDADTSNGGSDGDKVCEAALLTFDDPTITFFDLFGHSVAISGNYVLVGAPNDDTKGSFVGQAHLYDKTTCDADTSNGGSVGDKVCEAALLTFDDPTVTTSDLFGSSVSIDGNNVLVGAPNDDTKDSNVGQAHLYDKTSGALCKTFDDPTVTTSDRFGAAVAINGNNVLVGASTDDTKGPNVGQAHLFDGICKGTAVGGELIPLDTTMVLVAGTQTIASWMIPAIVAAIGIGIVIARKF